MTLRLNGSTSGYVEIDAPAVAGSTSITLPATAGEVAVKATDGSVDLGSVDIDSSGRLLVGTSSTSSISSLVVEGASSTNHGIIYLARDNAPPSSTSLLGSFNFSDNGHTPAAAIECRRDSGTWTSGSSQPTSLLFSTTADGASSPTERARIDSSGRLLVGTSSSRSVQVLGTATQSLKTQIEGATNTYQTGLSLINYSASSYGPSLAFSASRSNSQGENIVLLPDGDLGVISFNGADGTNFIAGAAIYAAVDGTPGANDMPGRLTFLTTADGASSPTERMRINSAGRSAFYSTSDGVVSVVSATANTSTAALVCGHSATSTTSGTASFYVRSNGNVQNTNNSYTAISDIKLKENVVDAKSQWDDLKALRVRNYNLKEGQTHTQIGLIAQEVELVSPGLVYETTDFDAEGKDLGSTTKVVQYSVLYMKAVKALQEAMERIEQLEAEMAEVKAQLS